MINPALTCDPAVHGTGRAFCFRPSRPRLAASRTVSSMRRARVSGRFAEPIHRRMLFRADGGNPS